MGKTKNKKRVLRGIPGTWSSEPRVGALRKRVESLATQCAALAEHWRLEWRICEDVPPAQGGRAWLYFPGRQCGYPLPLSLPEAAALARALGLNQRRTQSHCCEMVVDVSGAWDIERVLWVRPGN